MTELLTLTPAMIASAAVLLVTFIGIFTEEFHGFHRTKFGLAGAVAMIIVGQYFGFYSPEAAIEAVDWNVVFLLLFMMTIIAIMIPTGGFQALAYRIADLSKGRLFLLLVMLGTAVTVISLLLDNVTTVIIFGPLIVLICQALGVSPIPYLLAAALLSDTGGVMTLVGDPPNIMIGSAAGIDFNSFIYHMFLPVIAAWMVTIAVLRVMFGKELSAPHKQPHFEDKEHVKDAHTWYASLAVLGMMVVLFMLHSAFHWDAWFVAAIGLATLLFVGRRVDIDQTFEAVELPLIIFFISLFIVVGGVEHSRFLEWVGQFILPFVQADLLTATIVLMWGSAVFSAMIDNIPFTAAMIPIILGLENAGVNTAPLWWGLAIGVGMGGNGSHLGSTANVFIVSLSERIAKQANRPEWRITPAMWIRRGTPAMIGTLIAASLVMWLLFPFYEESHDAILTSSGGEVVVGREANAANTANH